MRGGLKNVAFAGPLQELSWHTMARHGAVCTRPMRDVNSHLWPYFNVGSYVSDLNN